MAHDPASSLEAALDVLSVDPENADALARLAALAEGGGNGHGRGRAEPGVVRALAEAKRVHRTRGDFELCLRLIDLEIGAEADDSRRADLYFDKGRILADELLREDEAVRAFERVLELRPGDETAEDALGHISLVRDNWQKILHKYIDEAKGSTDRQLTASLYLSVAELYAKYQPDDHVEQYLKRALDTDPRSLRASMLLERLYRAESRWEDLASLYEQRAEAAASREDRVLAYLALAELEARRRGRPTEAAEAYKKALAIEPSNARALSAIVEHYTATEAWQPLIRVYENVLRARPRGEPELGTLLQIAMIWWKKVGNLESADEYWKRIRKADPAHPAMLEFYRAYHGADAGKLLPILQQAQRLSTDEHRGLDLALETARAAEGSRGAAERAIDLWKGVLRTAPGHAEAIAALERLYTQTEKWNALLELHKEALEVLGKAPPAEGLVETKIERLLQMVRIYRDRLGLDVMVVSTYGQILQLRPDHKEALEALAQRYEALGRWNDLISVLQRRADLTNNKVDKGALLRRIADLWVDKFGNLHQAVRPLEELWAIAPDNGEVVARLRDLYTRRRAWRSLLDLERKEEDRLAGEGGPGRRARLVEIAKLCAERLGDAKEAIAAWNRLLELDEHDAEALAALAALYEREKRWPALVEILRRQASVAPTTPEARGERSRVSLLERAATLLAERLAQPERAAELYKEILALQPGHARATRTLQQLFAQEGRLDELVALYAQNAQWDELYDVMCGTAERLPATAGARRIEMLLRAAFSWLRSWCCARSAARAYERILTLDSGTAQGEAKRTSARALLPIYRGAEKWARLLATYEVLLAFADGLDEQLALMREIRELCEEKLGSRGLAFSWSARAYALKPDEAGLERDLERLAEAAETWDELAELYEREVGPDRPQAHRLRRLRQLAEIARTRRHRPDDARRHYEHILQLAPGDEPTLTALERLFAEDQSYPQLLQVYRQQDAAWRGAPADPARLELLFKMAWIEEEKLSDVPAARATLQRALDLQPGAAAELRALRTLERLEAAGGDARVGALAEILERQLALAMGDARAEEQIELRARVATLYADLLGRPNDAFAHLQRMLALDPQRRMTHAAIERLLDGTGGSARLDAGGQRAALGLLIPAYEDRLRAATGEEIERASARLVELLDRELKESSDAAARGPLLVRLTTLGESLPDTPARRRQRYAWAAERFTLDPASRSLRRALLELGTGIDRLDDVAVRLGDAEARAAEPSLKRELALELAVLFEGPLGMADDAETTYARVLAADPADDVAGPALERIYRQAERHRELRELLWAKKERALDPAARGEVLLAIAELDEGPLADREAAIASYRELLELDPSAPRAFRALERLYTAAERFTELEALLAAREPFQPSPRDEPEVRGTPESRAHLRFRRAELYRERLADLPRAVELYGEVLAEEPSHEGTRRVLETLLRRPEVRLRIARLMQPIYEVDQAWPKLALALGAEREALEGQDAIPLLIRLATLQEEKLGARQLALATWREALRIDPRDERTRTAVERLALLLSRHSDLAAAWDEAYLASDPTDLPLRAELLARSAKLYTRELRDAQKAEAAWRRLFDLDPGNAELGRPAAEALEQLYESQESWPRLVEILRRQVEWAGAPEARRELLYRIARIQEELVVDPAAATATYRELLENDPSDRAALDGLEKLHAAKSEWRDLADVLRRRLELEAEPKARRDLLFRMALLTERELGDPAGAVPAYGAVLDETPEDLPALDALIRLHEAAGRKLDLLEILERRIQIEVARLAAPATGPRDPARDERNLAGYRMRAAAIDLELGRAESAIERYREVLDRDGRHEGALRGLEQLLADPALKVRAAELLEPRYAAAGDAARLLTIHELMAEVAPDLRDRISRLERVAQLKAARDPVGAFAAMAKAARLAVGEPDLAALLDRLEAATPADGRDRLVELYRELGPDILDAATQERVQLTVAAESERLGDRTTAREYYRRVLDGAPDNLRALEALEGIYAADKAYSALYEIYVRRAEMAAQGASDAETRRRYLLLGARLAEAQLDRPADAIPAYEEALAIDPSDAATSRALEARYESGSRWHELADLLERRLGFTDELEDAIALRVRLGKLFEQELSDPQRAVESYRAALGGDPGQKESIAALERYVEDPVLGPQVAEVLEPVYVGRHDWVRLVRVCEIRLEAADDARARLALRRRIARIYEEQLEDLDGAFVQYTRVYREDPLDRGTRDQLARLAGVLDAWGRLAEVYEEHVAAVSPDGDGGEDALRALATIYHERLADVDRARAAYGRLLERDRSDEVVFFNLEKLLERNQRWPELLDAYREAAQATLDLAVRRRLVHKAAAIAEQRLADLDAAIQLHRSILEVEPGDPVALDALDRLFQKAECWHDLAELVEQRLAERTGDDPETISRWVADKLRLAELRAGALDDKAGAIELFEEVLARRPGEPRAVRALEGIIVEPDHTFRVAQILGPIYRAEGSWQKQVVILEAELQYLDDRRDRLARLGEMASLLEARGQDKKRAFAALLRAWREQAAAPDEADAVEEEQRIFGELCRLAEAEKLFPELCGELERAVGDAPDPARDERAAPLDDEARARVYRRLAALAETRLTDWARAIAALEKLIAIAEDDDAAWDALLRLLDADGRSRELTRALERRAAIVSDGARRRALYQRAAVVYEEGLREPEAAIGAWRLVLEIDTEDATALAALARLHRARGDGRELADVLERQIGAAADALARRALRAELAALAGGPLADPGRAADLWRAALAEDPRDRAALVELRRVELSLEHYPEALEATDALVELTAGPERDALRLEAAALIEQKLADPHGAIERYAALLAPDAGGLASPAGVAARRELERIVRDRDTRAAAAAVLQPAYERAGEWTALVELGELSLDGEGDPDERRRLLVGMAEAQARVGPGSDGRKAAFAIWARALREEPSDDEARAALERIAEAEGIPGELAQVYEELLAASPPPETARRLALRLGELFEERVGDEERAIAAYSQALEAAVPAGDDDGERAALRALDRLLSRAGRPRDLAEVLEKQAAAAADAAERVAFLHRLGALRVGELVDLDGALGAFRDALEIDATHAPSIVGLGALLGSAPHREVALDVLEPIAERAGDARRQNELAEIRLQTLDDRAEQIALLERIAERAEAALRDPGAALAAIGRGLTLDPAQERLADELQRLATVLGRPQEAAEAFERLSDLGDDVAPAEVRRELALRAGRLWEAVGHNDRAEARYQALVAINREDGEVLEALERLYRVRGDAGRLADLLARRAVIELDVEVKGRLFAEAARLAEESLGDPDGAIELWQKARELSETDEVALQALTRLYEVRGRWRELAELLTEAARAADEVPVRVASLSRVAAIAAERLDDLPRAVATLRELLDLDPGAMSALDSLVELEARRGDDLALKEALERKLGALPEGPGRIAVFRRLAEIADRRGEIDDALGYLFEILALAPTDTAAADLQRSLLERAERWHDLVDVLGSEAARRAERGDAAGELQLLVRAADVWEGKLESPDSAAEILERILARDPKNVRALLSLARIAEARGDAGRAREMLAGAETAAQASGVPADVAELAFRRGRVEADAGDEAAAAAHYRRALTAVPGHAGALAALLEHARAAGDHAQLAELLEAQLAHAPASDARVARLDLARLYLDRLKTPERARPHLEAVLAAPPGDGDAGARELLADLHFAAGRFEAARPLYAALLAAAVQQKKRGREVARLHCRLGEIAERAGDEEAALAAFSDAQRIDAGHAATLVAVGRLLRKKGDWEAARKTYRSLLLQNLDADAGITKSGVYLALGEIHERQDEPQKAIGMYERGLELDPPNQALKAALSRLRTG